MKRLLIIAAGTPEAEALRAALRHASGCQVIGYTAVANPCGWTVGNVRPDVILVDDGGDADATVERLREARENAPEATIVCRASNRDPAWPYTASNAGADATIDATVDGMRMSLLIGEICAGTVFRLPRAARPARRSRTGADPKLTTRELQILRLMAAGATNGSVARELWVTEQTVKFHLSNIYRKLGVANRTQASHYAHTHGLLAAPDMQAA